MNPLKDPHKYIAGAIWICLVVTLFIGQASAWTSSEFTRDEIKSLDRLTNFGTYEIKESAWYDPLKIWTEETIKSIELKTNTEQCVDCLSEGTIVLNKDGTLIDDFIWRRSFDNGKTFVDWKGYTNWKLLVEEDVDVFETTCVDGKEIIDEKNGTSYFEQDCTTSKTGTTKQWNVLDFKKEYKAGTYNYKIEGSKKSSVTYDWIIKTNGELLTNWAVWGAVIGVGGVEANITINSPANNSIQYTNSVTTSATANVTNGAYLTNASLNLSVNGGAWEIRNTSSADGLVSENTPGTWTENTFSTSQDGIKILTKNNVLVYNVTKRSYSGATSARILDASKNVIATASFSGNIATFSTPVELSNNTNYFIATWNNGNNYNIAYSSATSYTGTYYNFVEGLRGNNPNINMIEIVSVGMASYNFPTTLTVLFTNTFNAGDVVDFNYLFRDSDGDVGKSETRRFTIDGTAPSIALNYPTALIDYGKLNGTLQLNFTATDSNLDKVWYNYNGTNISIAGAVSGVYNISNITLSTKKNVTIYANDTAGNLNATTFSWDYKVFETGQEYSPITRAGSVESYALNVTLSSGIDLTSGKLIYAGQELTANIYTSGSDRRLLVANFETPLYTIDTNASFYWDLTITGGSVQTQNNTQLVQAVLIDNCSTHTNRLFNLSLFDEELKTSLRGDIQVNYQLLNKPTYGVINSILLKLTNVTNASVCSGINLSGEDIAYSAEIRYTSDDYVPEFYHIQRADIGTSVQTLNLYDLKQNDSTEFKITYQDNSYKFVEGAVVQLQRKYISEGTFEIVEAPLTSNEGTAVVHVDLDTNKYKITIVKDGEVLDIFDNIVFKCESVLTGECNQKLLGNIDPQNSINLDNLMDFAYSDPIMVNDTITLSFSIPSGAPSSVGLSLVQKDQFGNSTLCNRTITSSAGSLECEFDKTIGESYIELQITKNGELISETTYIVPEDSAMDFLGMNFIIVFLLLLSLVGMAFTSPEWIIVNGVITMLIGGALWLLNGLSFVVGLGTLMWLVIASAILIFKLAKQEDR